MKIRDDLSKLSKKELIKILETEGIKHSSSMKKGELIELLTEEQLEEELITTELKSDEDFITEQLKSDVSDNAIKEIEKEYKLYYRAGQRKVLLKKSKSYDELIKLVRKKKLPGMVIE
jgi:flagellar biosynthesis component FlhA